MCSNNMFVIEIKPNYDRHLLKERSKQWLLQFYQQKKSCVLFFFLNAKKNSGFVV